MFGQRELFAVVREVDAGRPRSQTILNTLFCNACVLFVSVVASGTPGRPLDASGRNLEQEK